MKRVLLLMSLVLVAIVGFSKEPSWLSERTTDRAYIGVGSASMDLTEWEQKAKDNALADLARQISVQIEIHSFFATMELDYSYQEYFLFRHNLYQCRHKPP